MSEPLRTSISLVLTTNMSSRDQIVATCLFVCDTSYLLKRTDGVIGDKKTTELVQLLCGDDETVNVAVGHPYEPLLAVSGIDYTVKLFSPDLEMQREFGENAGAENMTGQGEKSHSGPASRRRLQDSQRIIGQNAVLSETGLTNAVITVSLSGVPMAFADWLALWASA